MATVNHARVNKIRNAIIGLTLFDQMTRAFFDASSMNDGEEMPEGFRDLNRLEDNNLEHLEEVRSWAGQALMEMNEQMTIHTLDFEELGRALGYFISQEDEGESLNWDEEIGDFVSLEQ